MAYARSYGRRSRGARRRYAGRRRSASRRRPVRRRKSPRGMSKPRRKSILNVTSTKKMDTLMTVTAGGGHVVNMQPGTTSSGISATLWSPTALLLSSPNVSSTAARSAHTVFWRGIQENISLKTDTSDPFTWRRIVVELDTPPPDSVVPFAKYVSRSDDPAFGGVPAQPSLGMFGVHSYFRTGVLLTDTENSALQDALFRGVRDIDWVDATLASVDRQYRVLYDKTRVYRSPNDAGTIRRQKLWHPLNRNCEYEDAERGAVTAGAEFPTLSRHGLKNIFVWDQFNTLPSGTMVIQLQYVSKRYWHEK